MATKTYKQVKATEGNPEPHPVTLHKIIYRGIHFTKGRYVNNTWIVEGVGSAEDKDIEWLKETNNKDRKEAEAVLDKILVHRNIHKGGPNKLGREHAISLIMEGI